MQVHMVEFDAHSSDLLRSLEEKCAAAESPRPFAPLAEASRLAGDAETAAAVARQGLERFPGHLAIRLVLARALSDLGETDEALSQYRRVLERDAGNVEAASHLGLADAQPEPETSAEDAPAEEPLSLSAELEHLSDLFAGPGTAVEGPTETIATLTLAEIYARQGLTERAIEVCETILSRSPDDGDAAERLQTYRRQLAEVGT